MTGATGPSRPDGFGAHAGVQGTADIAAHVGVQEATDPAADSFAPRAVPTADARFRAAVLESALCGGLSSPDVPGHRRLTVREFARQERGAHDPRAGAEFGHDDRQIARGEGK